MLNIDLNKLTVDPQQKKLPDKVIICKKCVMTNQRPRIEFDDAGVCSACRYAEKKKDAEKGIDWDARKKEFEELLNRHRRNDGYYDVIVPCSGGKDSSMIAHKLKYEYGMHPLCVTFSPPIYTEIGWRNLRMFIDNGFDHILVTPNGKINRALTKAGFVFLGDHNEIFDHGQMGAPFQISVKYNVPLVMYGENGEAEYGGTSVNNEKPGMPWQDFEKIYYSTGLDDFISMTKEAGFFMSEKVDGDVFQSYRLPQMDELKKVGVEMHWFAYYHQWTPQENYYYAVKNTGFMANPMGRTEGTYSKYAQLDDLTDSFLYYMMFIKYGFGRTTSDAAHEVRDGHINRDEAIALVRRYDGEFPARYFKEFLEYVDLTEEEFWMVVDRFRMPHIWQKTNEKWKLTYEVK